VLSLILKLIADVGLVGFPNVGKSTLISRVSAARPKIADYPFTTLEPHLGVVKLENFRSFVIADIPGLIEGAHKGQGLGDQFLQHIERTRILVHMIDVSDGSRDPVSDYEAILGELGQFNGDLLERKQLVVASKMDALADERKLSRLKNMCASCGLEFLGISAVTGEGIKELINTLDMMLGAET
jgi:GTP-binding protein